jgi:hypothetical protein
MEELGEFVWAYEGEFERNITKLHANTNCNIHLNLPTLRPRDRTILFGLLIVGLVAIIDGKPISKEIKALSSSRESLWKWLAELRGLIQK